jgi:hypothetical protein
MNEFDTLKTVFVFLADNGMCNTAAEMWDEALVRWAHSHRDQERERKSEYERFLRHAASLLEEAADRTRRPANAILTTVVDRCAQRIVFAERLQQAPAGPSTPKSLTDIRELIMGVFGDNGRQALEEAIRRERNEESNDRRAFHRNGRDRCERKVVNHGICRETMGQA